MPRKGDVQRVFIALRPMDGDGVLDGFCRIEARSGYGQVIIGARGLDGGEARGVLLTRGDMRDCGAMRRLRGQCTLVMSVTGGQVNGVDADELIGAGVVVDGMLTLLGDTGAERVDARAAAAMAEGLFGKRSAAASVASAEVGALALHGYTLPAAAQPACDATVGRAEAPVSDDPTMTHDAVPSPSETRGGGAHVGWKALPRELPVKTSEMQAADVSAPAEGIAAYASASDIYPSFAAELSDPPSAHPAETLVVDSINASGRWEGVCAELMGAYERAAPCHDLSGIQGTAFRRMELPVDLYGMDYYLLGVRFHMGSPKALCYAVPGAYRAFPPPGLEGYRWRASDDGLRGYWLSWLDAVTGMPI